jgi:1-piperideine-2-carboxylate/1-pyrroline-2-carboxylate reductase [NAD(P)H]
MTPQFSMSFLLSPAETAARLPYPALACEIAALLADPSVQVPARLVQALPGGGSLFVMPALDARLAITKLITFTPANAGTGRPAIQGDVVVFDVATGERLLVLDGPTVTARRTAAVSVLAARKLAPDPRGPLLIVGAGAQGHAHLEAFVEVLGVQEVRIASRSVDSAGRLVAHARALGVNASAVDDADAQLRDCPLVVTCTPANGVVLRAQPRPDAFVAAVGAFTPTMVELHPSLCRRFAAHGRIVMDTPDAQHEAGDLLQAGLDVSRFPDLRAVLASAQMNSVRADPVEAAPTSVRAEPVEAPAQPVLFKSCGWAGWDLAAARCAVRPARP